MGPDMQKRMTPQERAQRHHERKIHQMAGSARRFVEQADYKRGCSSAQIAACYEDYRRDLTPIVRRMVEGKEYDHIHIPRRAASEYIRAIEQKNLSPLVPVAYTTSGEYIGRLRDESECPTGAIVKWELAKW